MARAQHDGVADAQVSRAFLHGPHYLRGQTLFQVDLYLAMFLDEGAQVLGQELDDGRNAGMHAHMAAHAVGVLAEFALHLLQAEQHRAGVMQQAFAGRRQVDTARVAVQQRGVEGGFQIGQALAHGGCGDELALGRLADAAEFAHRHEQLQRGEVDPAGEGAFGGSQTGLVIAYGDGLTADFLS